MDTRRLLAITLLLLQYARDGDVAAEHDEIWLGGPHPDQLEESDAKALKELGASWNEDNESWHIFT